MTTQKEKQKMKTTDYKTFIAEVLDITKNVDGSGLAREVESVISKYETYLTTTPVPTSIAKWVSNLYNLLDNCEGAGLQRELANLRSPLKVSA
jgi:hypothetical protein